MTLKAYFWLLATVFILLFEEVITTGAVVDLTVEGGVSLNGSFCARDVRLICKGEGLVSLRWRYNRTNVIHSFDTDDSPMFVTSANPAFMRVELTEVMQFLSDPRFANFTSSLTVDWVQLYKQNITDINCGDSGITDTESVDLQPMYLGQPRITKVVASYQSGLLKQLIISWERQKMFCSGLENQVVYILIISEVTKEINSTNCGERICKFTVNVSQAIQSYHISLRAQDVTTGFLSTEFIYSNVIERQGLMPQVLWSSSDCFAEAVCITTESQHIPKYSNCSIQYSTNPESFDTSLQILDGQFAELKLNSSSPYYFQFTIFVTDSFFIVEVVQNTTGFCEENLKLENQLGIYLGIGFGLAVIVIIIGATITIIISVKSRPIKLTPSQSSDLENFALVATTKPGDHQKSSDEEEPEKRQNCGDDGLGGVFRGDSSEREENQQQEEPGNLQEHEQEGDLGELGGELGKYQPRGEPDNLEEHEHRGNSTEPRESQQKGNAGNLKERMQEGDSGELKEKEDPGNLEGCEQKKVSSTCKSGESQQKEDPGTSEGREQREDSNEPGESQQKQDPGNLERHEQIEDCRELQDSQQKEDTDSQKECTQEGGFDEHEETLQKEDPGCLEEGNTSKLENPGNPEERKQEGDSSELKDPGTLEGCEQEGELKDLGTLEECEQEGNSSKLENPGNLEGRGQEGDSSEPEDLDNLEERKQEGNCSEFKTSQRKEDKVSGLPKDEHDGSGDQGRDCQTKEGGQQEADGKSAGPNGNADDISKTSIPSDEQNDQKSEILDAIHNLSSQLTDSIKSLKDSINEIKQWAKSVEDRWTQFNEELKLNRRERTSEMERVEQLEKDMKKIKQSVEKIEKAFEKAIESKAISQQEGEGKEDKDQTIKRLEKKVEEVTAQKNDLEKKLNKEIAELRAKYSSVKAENDKLRQEMDKFVTYEELDKILAKNEPDSSVSTEPGLSVVFKNEIDKRLPDKTEPDSSVSTELGLSVVKKGIDKRLLDKTGKCIASETTLSESENLQNTNEQ